MKSLTWRYGVLVYSHDGRVPSALARSVGNALRCSGRCAALLSTAAQGMVALSLRWAANGGAERRSCGTSGFIDVQGAAAAKDVRQNHPNLSWR